MANEPSLARIYLDLVLGKGGAQSVDESEGGVPVFAYAGFAQLSDGLAEDGEDAFVREQSILPKSGDQAHHQNAIGEASGPGVC